MSASRSGIRPGWTLFACAAIARVVWLALWPVQACSCDLKDWQALAAAMLVGINPYARSPMLNWPPMWMEALFVFSRVSDRLDWPLINCIRVALIAADVAMILSVWSLLRLLRAQDRAFRPVLWGLCLNPFLILLTIQQGNFDVIPVTLILWFLHSLIRFRREGKPIDWLLAAAWLGLGGFAKTFPLVLTPLLIGESRRLDLKTRSLGAALCFGPAALSLAPLYALNPHRISSEVIFYRGTAGHMGASGLLQLLGGLPAVGRYNPIFTAILLVTMILLSLRLWRRPIRDDANLILLTALILIGLFEFGTGYCPQYWMWAAPLLCIAYVQRTWKFRIALIFTAIIVIATNLLIFAYDRDLGSFALFMSRGPTNQRLSDIFTDLQHDLILISLPMTAATLLFWIYGVGSLLRSAKAEKT